MKKFWSKGDFFIWLTGATLSISLLMVAALLFVVVKNGLGFFWPGEVASIQLKDGRSFFGEVIEQEEIPVSTEVKEGTPLRSRIKVKQGNRDIYGIDFLWVDNDQIVSKSYPEDIVVMERLEWGDFFGTFKEFRGKEGTAPVKGHSAALQALEKHLPEIKKIAGKIRSIEKGEIGVINHHMEKSRLRLKKINLDPSPDPASIAEVKKELDALTAEYKVQETALVQLRNQLYGSVLAVTGDGKEKNIPLLQIVHFYQPNTFGFFDKWGFFFMKFAEFLWEDPRESNTEGGIFPAIFGTVMMVIIMSLFATPLGVLAAFYLREYAKQGTFVSIVRIAVNNLAGVPSIVFGVFGVGFFIYFIGGTIDRIFYPEALPTPTYGTGGILWASLTLALLTVPVVIVATEEGLAAVPRSIREASLALGATKFETIWRVVLPAVMPSILTGLILAMARAAGEVAPLMITGVVKLAPSLPVDSFFPFFHLERKFMHLGFHIYDVGFQSPNVDAARPMVYTTTLFLILIVLFLNFAAIALRNRIRKKLSVSAL